MRQSWRTRLSLQRRWTLTIETTIVLVLVGLIIYAEFVCDWRIARSDQSAKFTIGTTYGLSLVNYNRLLAENKRRYGDRAETNMDLQTGRIQVILDGRVLKRALRKRRWTAFKASS